jgi:hypothetical protein
MQFGFPFLWMLVFCLYSAERIASFLGEMGNGRNLYWASIRIHQKRKIGIELIRL